MTKKYYLSALVCLLCVGLATVVSLAGGSGGAHYKGVPIFGLCAAFAFLINWIAFIPAYRAQTEHFYDLTGSATYLSVIGLAVFLMPTLDERAKVVSCLVIIWALRLGLFLFRRVRREGGDDRFDEIKPNAVRFFVAWNLQALWVVITAACALTIITNNQRAAIDIYAYLGVIVWIIGFIIEVIADQQKTSFKRNPDNKGRFIQSGLWSWSRHPNYFGEIVLWVGVAIIALPVLHQWQWVTLISPIFVFALINYVSGVNKLEEKAEARWGENQDYLDYRNRTSRLMLMPPKR